MQLCVQAGAAVFATLSQDKRLDDLEQGEADHDAEAEEHVSTQGRRSGEAAGRPTNTMTQLRAMAMTMPVMRMLTATMQDAGQRCARDLTVALTRMRPLQSGCLHSATLTPPTSHCGEWLRGDLSAGHHTASPVSTTCHSLISQPVSPRYCWRGRADCLCSPTSSSALCPHLLTAQLAHPSLRLSPPVRCVFPRAAVMAVVNNTAAQKLASVLIHNTDQATVPNLLLRYLHSLLPFTSPSPSAPPLPLSPCHPPPPLSHQLLRVRLRRQLSHRRVLQHTQQPQLRPRRPLRLQPMPTPPSPAPLPLHRPLHPHDRPGLGSVPRDADLVCTEGR